ncbi:actin interacting protein 3-domain-containing protein [Crucibulum laeve]|uniref:Actin interacting protein 3-domain-containing protein n=1 Tax=Crucibulum laeve TaxID=68775 RepID=A0A5C3M5R7_9AGAR|nr:actin interacting protein 3-domain-containing protein [Crucibulum laeve]
MASRGGSGSQGHSSRRDHQSVSSTHSSSGRSDRERGGRSQSNPAVESAVTRLLVSIKQLLESLTQWSRTEVDEAYVSDVYVRLGNDFNSAVAAFSVYNIEMAELLTVPDDLRNVLEQCLSEEATAENLDLYLPNVRQIITNLLQGLRSKQSIYRRIVSDHRHRSGDSNDAGSRSSRGERSSRRGEGHRSQLSRTVAEEERPDGNNSVSRRSAQSSRRRNPESQISPAPNGEEHFVGGFVASNTEQPTNEAPQQMSMPTPFESQHRRQRSVGRPAEPVSPPLPPPPPPQELPPTPEPQEVSTDVPPQPPSPPALVPANVKRYSLVDKPVSPPIVVVDNADSPDQRNGAVSPPPNTPPIEPPPAVANSLAALKKNDVLERRASKRFSTYNISKMTGGSTTRERSVRGQANRRSLAVSSALTPGELAVLTEVDDEEPTEETPVRREGSIRSRRTASRPNTPERRGTPPVPRLPATPSRTPEPHQPEPLSEPQSGSLPIISKPPADPSRMTVFLQVGREVKKVVVEPGLSFSSLRVLFVDKFAYNPGQENFPAIYIRDPSSEVQYELEDTDEVKDRCLLSLNIEPLDQIKQHIDTQMSSLAQDIKDLKNAVATNNRHSAHIPDIPMAESTPAPNRPTDRQFQHIARRLSRFVGDSSPLSLSQTPSMPQIPTQMTGQSLQPQMTGASMMSEYTSRVVTDLKTQFDEVQNLRRDLGVMRQLYTEFMKQTKESLGTLRNQTQSVKQLANSSVGGARAYIDSGKKKLDTRSQNILTEVEKLQDVVEGVKDDVIKRQTTPNPLYFKNIKKDIDSAAKELESLKEHINTIKPMWKKTWEEELQNIVEEQQFLTHQEEFLNDLLEDHKSVVEIYGHVEKVVSLRGPGGSGRVRTRGFRPPPPEEGHNGLSTVMLEIRGAAVDAERRMKAIEASQRNREKELAAKSDDMQAELADFVGQKKLKMTGGAEEAERVRQRRNEQTMRAMFNGGSGGVLGGSTGSASPDTPSSPSV